MSPDLTFMADNALAASRVQQQIILASSDAEDDVDKDIMCFILGHIQDDHMGECRDIYMSFTFT